MLSYLTNHTTNHTQARLVQALNAINMEHELTIRSAIIQDSKKLSILFKQVYIKTYGVDGVSDEFANFITKQFSVERIEDLIKKNNDSIIVAEYKNNLVGVLEIDYSKQCPINDSVSPEINKIYILEWFCEKGIGNKLLNFAEKRLVENGYEKVWLWLLESNIRAHNFYKKHNYKDLGKASFEMEKNTYINLVMSKNLI